MFMGKIEKEIAIIKQIVGLYCNKKHNQTLCEDCKELLDYAIVRLQKCKFGEDKPRCAKCPVHCYKPDMRARMRVLMRYAGPRMLLYKPIVYAKHYLKAN